MRHYRCIKITGDKYAANWTVEAFAKAGIRYEQSDRDRSSVYMDTLPIFTSGHARLLDNHNQKMVSQFAALERRSFSTGRERIDLGRGMMICATVPLFRCRFAIRSEDGAKALDHDDQCPQWAFRHKSREYHGERIADRIGGFVPR
jgi:hypothetical protein